jgi:hypothetical protein
MTTPQIDLRHRPLRGLDAIAAYLGGQHREMTRRQIRRGMLDVSFDGKVATSTPDRIDRSPLITGAPPIEKPARPPRRIDRRLRAPVSSQQEAAT